MALPTPKTDTLQEIELAEGVLISLRPAGPLPRGLAYLIDAAVIVVASALLWTGGMILFSLLPFAADIGGFATGTLLILQFTLFWGYFIAFEHGRGATVGKKAMKLRVVRTSGAPPTLAEIVLRNLVRFADFLPFANALGLISMVSTKRFQRLGDLVANTLVIYDGEEEVQYRHAMQTVVSEIEPLMPTAPLTREEQLAVAAFQDRAGYWSSERRAELASLAAPLTKASGVAGVRRLLGMGAWLGAGDQPRQAQGAMGGSAIFEKRKGDGWKEFEEELELLDQKKTPIDSESFSRNFRAQCGDLALARDRMYGNDLIERLNRIVSRGYRHLHDEKGRISYRLVDFFWRTFPAAVRQEWRLLVLCSLAFLVPFLLMAFSAKFDPQWLQAALSPEEMAGLEESWSDDQDLDRGADGDFMMFGFYVLNNVSIDLTTFAGGLLGGIGALFALVYNGIAMGSAVGYVHQSCSPRSFYAFVAGHSAPELIAMVISAMAGMRLGLALLKPGRRTVGEAMIAAGKLALPMILGAAAMTLFAAVIEGFWSARPEIPPVTKYVVGIAGWVLCILYLGLGGLDFRRNDGP